MTAPLIFLDIDGVLNTYATFAKVEDTIDPDAVVTGKDKEKVIQTYGPEDLIEEELVANLNMIIASTRAKVVISSSWRCHYSADYIESLLIKKGFKGEVIGKTPFKMSYLPRAGEINLYLEDSYDDQSADRPRWVAIDDNELYLRHERPHYEEEFANHFVQTKGDQGLTKEKAYEVITLLQEKS